MQEFPIELVPDESGPMRRVAAWDREAPDPATLCFVAIARGNDVLIRLRVSDVGSAAVEQVAIRGSVSSVVTTESLRAFRLPQLVQAGLIYLRSGFEGRLEVNLLETSELVTGDEWDPNDYLPPVTPTSDGYKAEAEWLATFRKRGPNDPTSTRTIASLYAMATRAGRAPTAFIQDVLSMNSATASRWVAAARRAGTLPPSTRKPRAR